MIREETLPGSYDEARSVVARALAGARTVAVQAGHFMVYYDSVEDVLLPCIATDLKGPRYGPLRRAMGHFPLLSWDLGLRLLDDLGAERQHILVLVNDWQYCPAGVERSGFYSRFATLPESYRSPLDARDGRVSLLAPPRPPMGSQDNPFFSEQSLRNQYRRHVDSMIEASRLPPDVRLSQEDGAISCTVDDLLGRRELIYCSSRGANCTAEVAELIFQVHELSACDAFVNIFPAACREFVKAGTELSATLFGGPVPVVANLALPSTDLAGESDLWEGAAFLTVHSWP